MGLEITRRKNGSLRSKWWYGNFTVDGKRQYINLGIEIEGKVPKSLTEVSNVPFERSRMKAQLKLDELKAEARSTKTAVHHLKQLYEIKAGEELAQIALSDLGEQWNLLPTRAFND